MRLRLMWSVLFLVQVSAAVVAQGAFRTWTSSNGQHKVQAELVRVEGKQVHLKKKDGSLVAVSVEKLSDADRTYLATLDRGGRPPMGDGPDALKKIQADLKANGMRVSGSTVILVAEGDVSRSFRAVSDLRKKLVTASRGVAMAQQQEAEIKKQTNGLIAINARLNAQLAGINPNDVASNNRLVAAINSNQSQIQLMQWALKNQEQRIKAIRGSTNDVREDYIDLVLKLRKQIDTISQTYKTMAEDSSVKTLLAQLDRVTGKSHTFAESRGLQRSVTRLEGLEGEILTESIPLRRQGSTFHVSVVVNGNHKQDMVLDSGAGIVSLPHDVAMRCGIMITANDRQIRLSLADGRTINGHLVMLDSVRVGQFIAKNVECAVLSREASNAPPLLGMSFLGKFKFQVDAQKETLTLVRVNVSDNGATRRPRRGGSEPAPK